MGMSQVLTVTCIYVCVCVFDKTNETEHYLLTPSD